MDKVLKTRVQIPMGCSMLENNRLFVLYLQMIQVA
jgi:hypothetical protein